LVQMATGTHRIYWFFKPWESGGESIFGPFVNRDHFAFYMVMVTPMAFGLGATAYQRYRMRVGGGVNLRRLMVGLSAPEGLSLLYTLVPAVACIGSLLATTSRGALIAFGGGLVLALITLSRRQRMGPWSFVAVLTLAALSWYGLERIQDRMSQFAS